MHICALKIIFNLKTTFIMEENLDKGLSLLSQGWELLLNYGPTFIGAIVVLLIGLWVIKIINKNISRLMDNKDVDASLKPFFVSLVV